MKHKKAQESATIMSYSKTELNRGRPRRRTDRQSLREAPETPGRESEYARSLINASPDPPNTINADGKITDVNETSVKITGGPRGRLVATDFPHFFTDADKARLGYEQVLAKKYGAGIGLAIIRHLVGRHGGPMWAEGKVGEGACFFFTLPNRENADGGE